MRFVHLTLLFAFTAGVASTPAPVEALSCGLDYWDEFEPAFTRAGAVPVDAHPWLFARCFDGFAGCSLVAEDHAVEVDVLVRGTCEPFVGLDGYLVEFVPWTPLQPDRTYELECESGWYPEANLTTRTGDEPAAAPGEVELREAWIDRRGDGLCNDGDGLMLDLDGLDAPYLQEGGHIELLYPDGRIYPLPLEGAAAEALPDTEGPIELTPVAADGTRGDTLRVDDLRYREAVYIPCAIAREPSPWAAASLLPVVWAGFAARRRRRSR